MLTLVRLARVVLTLVLAMVTISLVIAVARPETGMLEKVVLVALAAGCVALAAWIATWPTRAQAWLHRP